MARRKQATPDQIAKANRGIGHISESGIYYSPAAERWNERKKQLRKEAKSQGTTYESEEARNLRMIRSDYDKKIRKAMRERKSELQKGNAETVSIYDTAIESMKEQRKKYTFRSILGKGRLDKKNAANVSKMQSAISAGKKRVSSIQTPKEASIDEFKASINLPYAMRSIMVQSYHLGMWKENTKDSPAWNKISQAVASDLGIEGRGANDFEIYDYFKNKRYLDEDSDYYDVKTDDIFDTPGNFEEEWEFEQRYQKTV